MTAAGLPVSKCGRCAREFMHIEGFTPSTEVCFFCSTPEERRTARIAAGREAGPAETTAPVLRSPRLASRAAAVVREHGGHLECEGCGRIEPLEGIEQRLLNGWPRCCDRTMTWFTAAELARRGAGATAAAAGCRVKGEAGTPPDTRAELAGRPNAGRTGTPIPTDSAEEDERA